MSRALDLRKAHRSSPGRGGRTIGAGRRRRAHVSSRTSNVPRALAGAGMNGRRLVLLRLLVTPPRRVGRARTSRRRRRRSHGPGPRRWRRSSTSRTGPAASGRPGRSPETGRPRPTRWRVGTAISVYMAGEGGDHGSPSGLARRQMFRRSRAPSFRRQSPAGGGPTSNLGRTQVRHAAQPHRHALDGAAHWSVAALAGRVPEGP